MQVANDNNYNNNNLKFTLNLMWTFSKKLKYSKNNK